MSDITALFLEFVRLSKEEGKGSKLVPPKKIGYAPGSDVFSKECSDLNLHIQELHSFLLSVRNSYVSSSNETRRTALGSSKSSTNSDKSLTEKEKDEIDYQVKISLQDCMTKLKHLEAYEKQRKQKEEENSTWFHLKHVGSTKTIEGHRRGMLFYLNSTLKETSDIQSEQQSIRLQRQLERDRSMLNRLPESINFNHSAIELEKQEEAFESLPNEQVQILEQENNELLEELEMTLNKAQKAEQSLIEISNLQNELATHLSAQSTMIESLVDDVSNVEVEMGSGNKQLQKAGERNRFASRLIVLLSIFFGLLLLFFNRML